MRRAGALLTAAAIALLTACTAAPATVPSSGTDGARTPVVDVSGLLTAPIPAVCQHAAGTLVQGSLPGIEEGMGGAYLSPATVEAINSGTEPVPLIAVSGAGEAPVIAAVVGCNMGGVGWPDTVVLWDADYELLGSFAPLDYTGGGREVVQTLEAVADGFDVRWMAAGRGDAECCGNLSASAVVDWTGSDLAVADVVVHDGAEAVADMIEAVSNGEQVPDSVAAPQAVEAVSRMIDLGGDVQTSAIQCVGELESVTGQRECTAPLATGEVMTFVIATQGWDDYDIVSAYTG